MRPLTIALVFVTLTGCHDATGPPSDGGPMNLGGVFTMDAIDGAALPAVAYPYPHCSDGQPRDRRIVGATLTLTDEAIEPEIPDPARMEWVESTTGCAGRDRDTLRLMLWGTFVAYPDSVAFDWGGDPMAEETALRDPDGLVLNVQRRDEWMTVYFR